MPRYNEAADWPWQSSVKRDDAPETVTPIRVPSIEADVNVPLMQAMASGALGAAAVGIIAGLAFWSAQALLIGAGLGYALIAGAVWCVLLIEHRRLLAGNASSRPQAGYRDDSVEQTLRVEIPWYSSAGRLVRMEYLDIRGVSEEQIKAFAAEVARGKSLAVSIWVGRGALFSRAQYDALMNELQRAGLVRDDGGNIGRVLTAAGRAFMKQLASEE